MADSTLHSPLPCLVCNKDLGWGDYQPPSDTSPFKGLTFKASGGYGSYVFDPESDVWLELNICDECVLSHKDLICLARAPEPLPTDRRPPTRVIWDGDDPDSPHWDGSSMVGD